MALFAGPAVSEIPDSKKRDSGDVEQESSGSHSGCESGMPGAWPEWSEAEDEQQKLVPMISRTAAGWTKPESLLGSGKKAQVTLSEDPKALWA